MISIKRQMVVLIILGLLCAVVPQSAIPVIAIFNEQENRSTQFIEVVSGYQFTCGLSASGGVKCWGNNDYGQLGDGTKITRTSPIDVTGLASGVIDIDAGNKHACAVLSEGGVKCWGSNGYGQLGSSDHTDQLTPVAVVGLSEDVMEIETGRSHTCALTTSHSIKCWGKNATGQLGNGLYLDSSTPVDVTGLTSGVEVLTAKGDSSCVVTTDGGAKCWGWNTGNGTDSASISPSPVDVPGLTADVSRITAGSRHTCAITDAGDLKCWGFGGTLGDGTFDNHWSPVDVNNLGEAVKTVSLGEFFTCAVTADGGGKCWGENIYGQLGSNSTNAFSLDPVDVVGLSSDISNIDAGDQHICAVTSSDEVKCWGDNANGQLGQGGLLESAVSIFKPSFTEPITKVAASSNHLCALTSSGQVGCWGSNDYRQLEDSFNKAIADPIMMTGLGSDVLDISVGSFHSCAVTASGAVKCWGDNIYGQLGDGNMPNSSTEPVQVVGLETGYSTVVSGNHSSCALSSGGGVKCWGLNYAGQLGDGSIDASDTPVDVVGLGSGVLDLTAGYGFMCALLDTTDVVCWGENEFGQLGNDNAPTDSNIPVQVAGLDTGVASIDAGFSHVCALMSNGSQKCWGSNENGEIGDNTTIDRHAPVDVTVYTGSVNAIKAGGSFTCVLTAANEVKCWGRNLSAELGDGTLYTSQAPVEAIGLQGNITQVEPGYSASCAITVGSRIKCWGKNDLMQLGSQRVVQTNVPLDLGEDYRPKLSMNYDSVSPGGFVALSGHFFEPETSLSLYADDRFLGTLATTPTGNFIVFLEITGEGEGLVSLEIHSDTVTISSIDLIVGDTNLAHLKEGDGQTFELYMPPSFDTFLPLLLK